MWFQVDSKSLVEFNAISDNEIRVYPLSAYQYINGTWVGVTAKTYISNEWKDWGISIVKNGIAAYTINKAGKSWSSSEVGNNNPSVGQGNGYILCKGNREGYGMFYFSGINLTGRSQIILDCSVDDTSTYMRLAVWSSLGSYITSNMVESKKTSTTNGIITLPINLSGSYMVGVTNVYITSWRIRNLYVV